MSITAKIKWKIRKLILGYKSDSESFLNHHRALGARIGKGTFVFEPNKTFIDETRPFLIEIGENVQMTRGVTFLTHGYDWSVFKGLYGQVLGSAGKITIGNNVFIGVNTVILKGVTVGNNVVIGANSLVNKDIPDNCVYAGNPARYICSIEEYFQKRKKEQMREAECIYREYVTCYGKEPPPDIFHEFFWLFHPRNEELLPEFRRQMETLGNYDYAMEVFKKTTPIFSGYEAFLQYLRTTVEKEQK